MKILRTIPVRVLTNINHSSTHHKPSLTIKNNFMKINELRVGNIVGFYNGLEPKRFVTITARFFSSFAGGRALDEIKPDEEINGYYSPIHLTSELLTNIFEYTNGVSWGFDAFYEGLSIEDNDGVLGAYYNGYYLTDIEHLHQLQNLYFALTGTELPINH